MVLIFLNHTLSILDDVLASKVFTLVGLVVK